jgi:tRNA (guanine-N7-)-methyltransferase
MGYHRTEPVSFTRRGGRLNQRQQNAWDARASTVVIDIPRGEPSTSVDPDFQLDLGAVFGRQAPLTIEIGIGHGEALVAAAAANPGTNFLGLEVYVPGIAQTLAGIRREGVDNIRLVLVNATEALATLLPAGSARELWVNFPDPWPKQRHHKRRLIDDAFVPLAERVLGPGGVWRIATDWAGYADAIRDVLGRAGGFDVTEGERFEGRVQTKFETKGIRAGRVIHDFTAVKSVIPAAN